MSNIASYEENKGKISFTYETSGLYGAYINECRLSAWELAINRNNISLESVCDVGCSNGSWASNWKKLGFKYLYGIEKIVDEVGTFLKAPGKAKSYMGFLKNATYRRGQSLGGFAEVLLVMKKDG